jgi:hypothetical protein
VFDHILQRMQEKVRALDYVMTIHAEEEMEDDDLSSLWNVQSSLGRLSSDSKTKTQGNGST